MTKHLVRLQLDLRSDRGQGALEYIGILAVVALVIGFAITGFTDADIAGRATALIADVIG